MKYCNAIFVLVILSIVSFFFFVIGAQYGHDKADQQWRDWTERKAQHRTITKEEEIKIYRAFVDAIYTALNMNTNK